MTPPPTGARYSVGGVSAARMASPRPMATPTTRAISCRATKPPAVNPPGRPARLSFSWTACCCPPCMRLVMTLPSLSKMGLITRSLNGRLNSASVRLRTCRPLSLNCARRASRRSDCVAVDRLVSPKTMKVTPMKAKRAATAARITSHLDLDDLLDGDRPNGDREDADPQHDVTAGLAEHRSEVGRRDQLEETGKPEGKQGDDDSRDARLGGERPDLAGDAHALADGVGDGVEDLSEVAADHSLDLHGGHQEVEVLRLVAVHHVVESVVHADTKRDFACGSCELLGDGRRGVAAHRGERLGEGVTGLQRVAQQRDGVTQLVVESTDAPALADAQEDSAEQPGRGGSDQQHHRRPEAQEEKAAEGDADAGHGKHPLRRLELEVRFGEVVGELAGV